MTADSGAQPDTGDHGEGTWLAVDPRAAVGKADRAIALARARRERSLGCEGEVTPSLAGRVQAYRAAHPEHQFVRGDVTGTMAVIARRPAGPEIVAWADDLPDLLDKVGAPDVAELS